MQLRSNKLIDAIRAGHNSLYFAPLFEIVQYCTSIPTTLGDDQ